MATSEYNLGGIELRRRPTQARSAATFDHILETATLVLEDVGWEGFTTNLLAKRAGVGLQALYRYFPNKLAVIATLTKGMIEDWGNWFNALEERVETADVSQLWNEAFDVFVDGVRNTPGCVAIRRAMSASPQLKALDQQDNALLSERLKAILLRLNPELDEEETLALCRVLIETVVAVVDLTFDMPDERAEPLLRQCKAMQGFYLQEFVSSSQKA